VVADLRTLRTLAELLLRLDAVTFLGYLESLRASEAVGSVWLFHDAAHTIFEQAKRRVWAMGGGAAASKRKRAGAGGEAVRRGPGAGGALPGICSLTQTLTRCVCQLACTPRSAPRDRSVVDGEGQRLGARRSPWSRSSFLGCMAVPVNHPHLPCSSPVLQRSPALHQAGASHQPPDLPQAGCMPGAVASNQLMHARALSPGRARAGRPAAGPAAWCPCWRRCPSGPCCARCWRRAASAPRRDERRITCLDQCLVFNRCRERACGQRMRTAGSAAPGACDLGGGR